ncbi:hypothetical protein [Shewanella xiamenensis]|uniref:hypothetical protein n=1 Tax=Shewanella xiamenensis TaxID=332186 RepID=UPI00313BC07D
MGNRFGTQTNPIVLVPEVSTPSKGGQIYGDRKLLLEHSKLGVLGQNITNVVRKSSECMYVNNVISNPFLKPLEIKLALFLYEKYLFLDGGFVVVSDKEREELKFSELGGKDYFYSRKINNYMEVSYHSKSDIENLLTLSRKKLNIKISASALMSCLSRLHDFGYVTMTKIHYYNSEDGLRYLRLLLDGALECNESIEVFELDCQEKIKADSIVKHIRLSEYMQRCDMSNKWYSKLRCKKLIADNIG